MPHLINSKDSDIKNIKGLILYKGVPFTGTLIKLQENSNDTISIGNYLKGKKTVFLRDSTIIIYCKNKENSLWEKGQEHKGYWDNGKLAFYYLLKEDVYDGTQRDWNRDGQLIKSLNYVDGHQEVFNSYGIITVRQNKLCHKNNRRYRLVGNQKLY